MSGTFLAARLLFAMLFIGSGVAHIAQADAMTQYAQAKGVPQARLATAVSGVWIVIGGLSVALGLWGDNGALMLVVFLVPATFVMTNFWAVDDPMAKQTEQVMFMKNIALCGGGLAIFVMFATLGDTLGLTITGSAFELQP
jgi:putative oxidoreductase